VPPPLPARLQRVLDPIVREFTNQDETREAPADGYASDDDVDDVMEVGSDEVEAGGDETPAPPAPPALKPAALLPIAFAERADGPSEPRHQDSPSPDDAPGVDEAEAPPARDDERRTQELPAAVVELGDPLQPVPPSFGPSPSKQLSDERLALFERVRANPLDPDGYRMLAEHFDTANDANRSSLMLELARALEGDPNAAPRTPKLILSAADRAGLRHPLVRSEAAELVTLSSPALCRLFPAKGRDASTTVEFSLESGKGARSAADAEVVHVCDRRWLQGWRWRRHRRGGSGGGGGGGGGSCSSSCCCCCRCRHERLLRPAALYGRVRAGR